MYAAADSTSIHPRSAFKTESESDQAGQLGMWLLLIALGMLFAASLVAFLVIRLQLADTWPSGQLTLPSGLWLSTVIMLISSATIHGALTAARRERNYLAALGIAVTFGLGLLFLAVQVQCWLVALAELRNVWFELNESRLAATGFYVFSGIHGLHVVGGLIPMSIIALRTARGRYTPHHLGGLRFITMYWHFLDGVWLVLFATLLIGL